MPKRATPRFTRSKVFTIIHAAVNAWTQDIDYGETLKKRVIAHLDAEVTNTINRLIDVWALGNGQRYGGNTTRNPIEEFCLQRSKEIMKEWISTHEKDLFQVKPSVQVRLLETAPALVESEIVSALRAKAKEYAATKAEELFITAKPALLAMFDAEETNEQTPSD